MKVSDIIKLLEPYSDKEFYHLRNGNTNKIEEIEIHLVDEVLFLSIKDKHDFNYISDFESLDEGFVPRKRTESELYILKIENLRESRRYDYSLEVGSTVVLDEEIMFDYDKENYFKDLIGKKGVVTNRTNRGGECCHVVEWENGRVTKDTDFTDENIEYGENFMPKNYLASMYLKNI